MSFDMDDGPFEGKTIEYFDPARKVKDDGNE
jgi:hypothetical protein